MRHLIIFSIFFVCSCNSRQDDIRNCIAESRENKVEISKVVNYYKNKEEFKNKYVIYTISNMPTHYS